MSDGIKRMYEDQEDLQRLQELTRDFSNQEKYTGDEIRRLEKLHKFQEENRAQKNTVAEKPTASGYKFEALPTKTNPVHHFTGPGMAPYQPGIRLVDEVAVGSAENIKLMLERAYQAGQKDAKNAIKRALGIH